MYKGHFDLYVATDKWNNESGVPHRIILPISNIFLASANRPKTSNSTESLNQPAITNSHVTQPHLFIWNQYGSIETALSSPTVITCLLIWEKFIICGREDGIISVRTKSHPNQETGKKLRQNSRITALASESSFFMSAAVDGSIFYWDSSSFRTGNPIKQVTLKYPQAIQCLLVGNGMLMAGTRETIAVWNSVYFNYQSSPDQILKKHVGQVVALVMWNSVLASASWDHTIGLWNECGECIEVLEGHTDLVLCLCVWQGRLFSGSTDTTIRIWAWNASLKAVVCVAVLRGYASSVTSLCVWNDKLWCCCWNGSIMSWKSMS